MPSPIHVDASEHTLNGGQRAQRGEWDTLLVARPMGSNNEAALTKRKAPP